jgi:hypothetical protein
LSPYKPGDRVLVEHKDIQEVLFILAVENTWYRTSWGISNDPNLYYKYTFARQTKGGSISKQSAGIWNGKIIKKVD